eukprot:TRINITY_DN5217_c0_g1_i4.p1 TRINITY_DN5217_c0_g1~~TRINITY_DN5217_c0_g1_i4.p1  ORF type:complete len:429 (-),score=48.18 TRINITY_DN5217_c0_g1_i4:383-1669(-)
MGVPKRVKQKLTTEQQTAAGISQPQVWRAGVDEVQDDEELTYDPSVYTCFKSFMLEWPCLSFCIIKDGLGGPRSEYPHTFYMVAGTQAESADQNSILIAKISNLQKNKSVSQHQAEQEDEEDEEYEPQPMLEDEDEEDSDDADESQDPAQFQVTKVQHNGGINRIRNMPQQPSIIVTWSDTGVVKVEGFAVDWSPAKAGRLASGDNEGAISVSDSQDGANWGMSVQYDEHIGSVEDIQWSPSEENVFISGASDNTIRVWDVRQRGKAMVAANAHNSDVNVLSWNPLAHYMLVSGDDNGCIKVWDLRNFGAQVEAVAQFNYHQHPITSVEWCPQESSTFVSTAADDQLIVWDLAVERDPEEEAELGPSSNANLFSQIPPQVLFVHTGQSHIKEAHWHPQIPGLIVSTSESGFNVLHPYNINPLEEKHNI